jgi:hypothetical protein
VASSGFMSISTHIVQLLTNISAWDRYSNTLLVSLNNRISIRETSVACGGVVRSPVGSVPSTARSEATTDVVLLEMEKRHCPNAFKLPPLHVIDPQERVIGESHCILLLFYHISDRFPELQTLHDLLTHKTDVVIYSLQIDLHHVTCTHWLLIRNDHYAVPRH